MSFGSCFQLDWYCRSDPEWLLWLGRCVGRSENWKSSWCWCGPSLLWCMVAKIILDLLVNQMLNCHFFLNHYNLLLLAVGWWANFDMFTFGLDKKLIWRGGWLRPTGIKTHKRKRQHFKTHNIQWTIKCKTGKNGFAVLLQNLILLSNEILRWFYWGCQGYVTLELLTNKVGHLCWANNPTCRQFLFDFVK